MSASVPQTVVLDTNALMMPVELDVRLFDELDRVFDHVSPSAFELQVPQPVIGELRDLAAGGGEAGIAASVGQDLASDRCVSVAADAPYADDAVVELVDSDRADYVVTNDAPLRDRVLDRGVPVISLRGSNTLAITEP